MMDGKAANAWLESSPHPRLLLTRAMHGMRLLYMPATCQVMLNLQHPPKNALPGHSAEAAAIACQARHNACAPALIMLKSAGQTCRGGRRRGTPSRGKAWSAPQPGSFCARPAGA